MLYIQQRSLRETGLRRPLRGACVFVLQFKSPYGFHLLLISFSLLPLYLISSKPKFMSPVVATWEAFPCFLCQLWIYQYIIDGTFINDTFYQLINTNTGMYMILDRHSRRRMISMLLLIEGQTNLHWPISIEKNLPSWTPGKRHQPGFNNHNYFQKSRHATRLIFIQSTKLHTLFHMGICNAE